MALADTLKNLAGVLGLVGAQGGAALGNALQAQANPVAYQQMQQNQRQQQMLDAQSAAASQLTPYQSAQVGLEQQRMAEQQQMDRQAQGLTLWKILQSGATKTPAGETPDFTYGNTGFSMPAQPTSYSIKASEPLGQYLGLTQDVSNLDPTQYLKAYGEFAATQQAQKDTTASQALLDVQKQNARLWLAHRFSPQYSQTLYGANDPTAPLEAQNLSDELEAIPDLKSMAAWQDRARGVQTEWEKLQDKRLDLKNSLALKAADAAQKGDPHLMSAVLAQSRSFDELEKPIESEWNTGNNIIALANQRTPAADAQLITAMMPYVTGVKRFNQAEIQNAAGGATAWTNLQRTLNKYASNPSAAQIPEVQRQQLISILQAKQASLKQQLTKINDARDDISGMDTAADVLKRSAKLHRDLSTQESNPTSAIPQVGGTFNGGRVLSVTRIN